MVGVSPAGGQQGYSRLCTWQGQQLGPQHTLSTVTEIPPLTITACPARSIPVPQQDTFP